MSPPPPADEGQARPGQDTDWQKTKAEAAARRQEIIDEFNEDQKAELEREIEDFGPLPTAADIYLEAVGDEQYETATWSKRRGRAAGYSISRRRRERKNADSPWPEWSKWKGYKPDDDTAETFESQDEAIKWLRTQPLEDAGEGISIASTYESDRRRSLATGNLLEEIALPPGWVLDRASDSQYGSKYWNVRGPLTPENNEDDDRAFAFKLSVRSHEPSAKWQAELGQVDYYVPLAWGKGNAIHTVPLENLSHSMEMLEDWMWKKHVAWTQENRSTLAMPPVGQAVAGLAWYLLSH